MGENFLGGNFHGAFFAMPLFLSNRALLFLIKNILFYINYILKRGSHLTINLRYYAILKVRKFESLFYKINTCLQKTTTCIGLRAEQIFSVNI